MATLFRQFLVMNYHTEDCPFTQFLRQRILEYNSFGLWMHAHANLKDDKRHIANILFVDMGSFTTAIRESGLTSEDGDKILYKNFAESAPYLAFKLYLKESPQN